MGGGISAHDRMSFQGESFLRRYGPRIAERAPPVGEMLRAGVQVGLGTDATRIASYNPWKALQWFVTGRTAGGTPLVGAANRLDRMQALRQYTVGSAWFSGDEAVKGALAPGMFADLAVLSADYFSVPEDQIQKIEALLTVMNGKVVHAKGAYRSLAPAPLPVDPAWSPVVTARQDEGRYLGTSAQRGAHRCGHLHTAGDRCGGVAHVHNWLQGDSGLWSLSCHCMVV